MFKNFKSLMLKISGRCNMSCDYCFQRGSLDNSILDLNKDLVEFIKSIPKEEYFDIKYIGGEPLLYVYYIKEFTKAIRKIERTQSVKFRFGLTTNGIYSDSLIELLDEGYLDERLVRVSWDGIKSSKIRKSVYSDSYINQGIYDIVTYYPNVCIRLAITEANIDYIYTSVLRLLKYGAKVIELYYIMDYPKYKDPEFIAKCKKVFEEVAELTKRYEFTYVNWEPMKHNKEKKQEDSIRCSHLGSHLHIDSNGDLYPCGMFSDDTIYTTHEWKIGDIYNGINEEICKEFEEELTKAPDCSKGCSNNNCFECPAVSLHENNSLHSKLRQQCKLKSIEKEIYNKFNGDD